MRRVAFVAGFWVGVVVTLVLATVVVLGLPAPAGPPSYPYGRYDGLFLPVHD